MQYIQMCDMLEQNEQQKIDKDRKCKVLSYCTFDNADLVLLIQGNSLRSMEQKIRDIEGNKEVQYLHSILGVSEEYLQACGEKRRFSGIGTKERVLLMKKWRDWILD